MPGLPMRPVARWQLMMALTLSVPCADWFTPCEKQVTAFVVGAEQLEEARDVGRRQGRSPRAVAATSGAISRARASASAKPVVCASMKSWSSAPISARCTSRPQNSAVSVPGAIGRNRSASSPVAVRRGSMTTILAPRSRRFVEHALEQHRMAPGGVRADEHDQVGLVEVLVAAGHRVGAEGAAVAGDRRRHAQPRIGVDVGRADEALHQLVGDVIVLGQQLAGEIERDRVRPVALDDAREAVGDRGRAPRPSRCARAAVGARSIGCSSRPSRPSVSPSAEPFEHSRPKFAGCSGSPAIDGAAAPVRRGRARRSRRRNTGRSVRTGGERGRGACMAQ